MEIIDCYKSVIADITADDTWITETKEQVLSLLRTRLMELETVWSIPDELWNAEFDEVELPEKSEEPDQPEEKTICSMCNGAGEDRYEQRCRWCRGRGVE